MALNFCLPHLLFPIKRNAYLKLSVIDNVGERESLTSLRKCKAKIYHARLAQVVAGIIHSSQDDSILIVGKLGRAHTRLVILQLSMHRATQLL